MFDEAKKLSVDPYKGVRDFFPEDMAVQEYIFGVWKKAAESFGYEEYGASVLEPAELYRAKSGEEIVNEQTYTFTDRGGREVTMRPEMTPTAARMVTAKRRELSLPLRWYSIPNLFRYEQPQRGRVREHWQLNIDLFGADSTEADAEVIILAHWIMKAFGAKEDDFTIKISSRHWLNKWFSRLGLEFGSEEEAEKKKKRLLKILDNRDKDPGKFAEGLREISPDLTPDAVSGQGIDLGSIEKDLETKAGSLMDNLKISGVNNARIDLTGVVRGFDYYTGVVFEIYDTDPANRRSLFGGGRYDDLASLFGGHKIPAIGFGVGDVTIRDFLETHGLLPEFKSKTDIHVCTIEESLIPRARELAAVLRAKGMNVSVNLTSKKIGDQIAWADKHRIPKVIVVGEEEAAAGKYKIKELATGAETAVAP